ncbi:hypothetical protein ACFX2J_016606 [Malus domestica]|uniref:Cytochrome P450 n=1 Tax=Malus domestica TaxID=3750 RepID=A0A498HRA1_MALDO|nr:hypothetical protein DVH24_012508 [Malus domestica]
MEELLWYSLALIIFTLLLTLSIPKITQKHKKNLPSSPPSLPIIGHLHLIKQPIHRTLQPLNSNFGKVLLLRWGSRRVLLISSPSVAEEIFTKHDITFASRPRLLAGKHFNYNFTTVTVAPYGDLWRNLRRVMTLKVFSSSCLAQFSSLRQGEVRLLLNQTMKSCTDKVPKGMDITGTEKKMMSLMAKLDSFLQGLVDERRESLSADSACNGKDVKKLMIDNLLALQEKEPQFYTDQIIKGYLLVGFHNQGVNWMQLSSAFLHVMCLSKCPAQKSHVNVKFFRKVIYLEFGPKPMLNDVVDGKSHEGIVHGIVILTINLFCKDSEGFLPYDEKDCQEDYRAWHYKKSA